MRQGSGTPQTLLSPPGSLSSVSRGRERKRREKKIPRHMDGSDDEPPPHLECIQFGAGASEQDASADSCRDNALSLQPGEVAGQRG